MTLSALQGVKMAGADCGEKCMLLACGVEPRGYLRLAHKAAALSPTIIEGPHMPVSQYQ